MNESFLNFGMISGFIKHGFQGSIEDFVFDKKYDIIASSHVLEHIKEPRVFIQKLVQGLNERGIIFLEFPVGDRKIASNYFHIAHLNHFTIDSIYELTLACNLNVVLIDKFGTRGGDYGAYRVVLSKEKVELKSYLLEWGERGQNKMKQKFKKFQNSSLFSKIKLYLKYRIK